MTKPHRATPEHWETIENYADTISYSCIIELRDRIEKLEAAQQARTFTAEEVAPGSVLERMTILIANFASTGLPGDDATPIARVAILVVAAALLDWWDSDEVARTTWEAAKWLEQEASQ